jgi:hypothetical protein
MLVLLDLLPVLLIVVLCQLHVQHGLQCSSGRAWVEVVGPHQAAACRRDQEAGGLLSKLGVKQVY